MASKQRQIDRIYDYMKTHGSITQKEANMLSVARLASRVNDMKKSGMRIVTSMECGVNQFGEPTRYARYFLKED